MIARDAGAPHTAAGPPGAAAGMEIRDPEEARRWFCAGLTLMRLAPLTADEVATVMPWSTRALSEMGSLPPAGVVSDIGRLLFGAPLELKPLVTTDVRLRAAIRAYEDEVLGRLATDRHLQEATDAALRLAPEWRADAVALICQRILGRIRFRAATSLSPAALRRLERRPAAEVLEEGLTALAQGDRVADLARGYEELARSARQVRALLGDGEVFALENLAALSSMAQRLAIEHIAAAAEALEGTLPRRIQRSRASRGATPTQLDDESAYPIGGFSSMSTSGTLENLVTSELIYMEESADQGEGPAAPLLAPGDVEGQVDLFDLRYVEGELLYYTRDEAIYVRSHRVVTFVLPPELTDARVKDPELEWQRLILVCGLILCVTRRLSDWLSDQALLVRVVLIADAPVDPADAGEVAPAPSRSQGPSGRAPAPTRVLKGKGPPSRRKSAAAPAPRKSEGSGPPAPAAAAAAPQRTPLAAERVLCELLLRSWIDKGAAEVSVAARLEDAFELPPGRLWAVAVHDRIVVRTRAGELAAPDGGLMILDVSEPAPVLRLDGGLAPRDRGAERPGGLWQAWADAALELLRALV
jgi:vWA domain found in the FtsH ternary systems/N-terminal helical region fused to the FtsH ternary system vWA domain